MDKESIYELQKIDCNCSDCGFMIRDSEKRKESVELHVRWQQEEFDRKQQKLKDIAYWHRYEKGNLEVWDQLLTEAENMKFQHDKSEAGIHYGQCSKLSKPISFIPATCSPETQQCFTHRKDLIL